MGVSIESGFQFIPVISKYINYEPNNILAFSDWAKWLLPVLLFIFVQSAAEELVFRGYLLQLIWSKNAGYVYAVILPSLFLVCSILIANHTELTLGIIASIHLS